MAAAIARHHLAVRGVDGDYDVASAGIAAGEGGPTTPEAVHAVRKLGIDFEGTTSSPLTQALLDEAATIYTLTAGHRDAILRAAPHVADRLDLLDPDGHDIPDPIGYPQDVYDETAAIIQTLIARRLDEILTTA